MKSFFLCCGMVVLASANAAPLAKVGSFGGKFQWVKLNAIRTVEVKSFAGAKTFVVKLTFTKDAKLKKDKGGNIWFTIVIADQPHDWSWKQTTGYGAVPATAGVIKAGSYLVNVPTKGIPASTLKDSLQTISVGPGSSGLVEPTAFTVDSIKGK